MDSDIAARFFTPRVARSPLLAAAGMLLIRLSMALDDDWPLKQ
ncbi:MULTISPECIES: hypothetical protein [Paeniglutamicibacter]|nr:MULTISPECIES: hypothetical protein [Paeniglutamicibacter]